MLTPTMQGEATEGGGSEASPAAIRPRSRLLEIVALVLLVAPIGLLPGLVLVALSRIWSFREKLIGIALAVAPAVVLFLLCRTGGPGDDSVVAEPIGAEPMPDEPDSLSGPLLFAALAVTFFSGLPSVAYLGWRLHART
ncbi:MAG: hypothetical protein M3321_02475 [Actinomycetota bacterium]|nr:hypothetical protein [Actinomycetota bacterium]